MKILIVDDNSDDRRVLQYMIEKNGHEAIEAEDGFEGLEKARSTALDLIISDALMPVMDGFQFLREVKQDQALRSIPFIFYSSSYKEYKDVRLAMSLGAEAYVIKPVDPVELWGKIEDILGADKKEKVPTVPLIKEDAEYLKRYSEVVATKLEEKVRELERTLEDRKRAEEALRVSEEKYRTIFEESLDGLFITSPEGKILDMNKKGIAMFGYGTKEEIQSLDLAKDVYANPADRQRILEMVNTQGSAEYEMEVKKKSGETMITHCALTAAKDQMGRPVSYRGIIRDITERKRADEALKKSEAFIKNILETVDVGFIVLDREYRIESANKAFCNLVALPAEQVIGRKCYEVAHHQDMPCFETGRNCPVRLAFETGASHTASHVQTDEKGTKLYVDLKAYPVTDKSNTVASVIETIYNVTEKKKLEEQLRQAQKMEAVGTLAGGVAHDFNNILTTIMGYGNLMKMKMDPADPLQASIDTILSSSEKAANLTHGLLSFSRKQIMNPKPVNLVDIIKNVEKLLRRLITEDIEISTIFPSKNIIIMADAVQIEQVLMNLATNARDAMPEGGKLTITTGEIHLREDFITAHGYGKPGKHALITVSDTGMGMDEETREKIFEPFFTTKELGKGTGLGLSIVYGIVKQHDGNINVYSEPGEGTIFKIYLPLFATHIEKEPIEAIAPPRGGTETILLAEDDLEVRTLTKAILADFGYRVIDAIDGQDALHKFTQHPQAIDLLVLDVIMPKKSGKEVYDAIRPMHPDIDVLFISGYTADILQNKGFFEAGLPLISKPVNPFELLRKIREIIDKPGSDVQDCAAPPEAA